MNSKRASHIEILLVEDNPGDARLMSEAFAQATVKNRVTIVTDGESALNYLRHEGDYRDASRPDLILLDLNLPLKGGHDVLAEIKSDVELRRIPVVVLTGSKAEQDIATAYNLNVNSYITKPQNHDELVEMVHGIEDFWLTVVRLPRD